MITKDLWNALDKAGKNQKITECLEQLYSIKQGTHPLSGKLDQGKLAGVKKDLEAFLINAAEWESNKQLQQQKQHFR
jgi:hypothetical protein